MKYLFAIGITYCFIFFTGPAKAVYFDSIIYELDANKDFLSKPIYNDTKQTNLYNISAYKIRRPGDGNEGGVAESGKELMWSPLKFSVQPNGKEYFKLYYRGPEDNIERYYRVIFKEIPLTMSPYHARQKNMSIIPVVAMSTIFIVRPRKIDLKFEIDETKGLIRNTGNTFFRVIIQKGCNGDDESSKQFYMLPGETWYGPDAKANNRKYIVAQSRYHHLGEGCFNTDSIN